MSDHGVIRPKTTFKGREENQTVMEIKIRETNEYTYYCFACGHKVEVVIDIGKTYIDGAAGIEFCLDCIKKVKNGINEQLREYKKNG